ncbi:Acetyltransferase (GNAT) family protein [Natronincola peptidivorans]|uniref:Acetyltransferase (GNAT) family protein n=1 Tax=Natronincola peptidivorans TaxID=426128 RepID=A0A1I0DN65_9FIRM|nr:N-acetyltransferase [Natronincola peptidivorans]SET33949.1 Acetyltransferase (GNAT) family protein [Natronincola peptidivorans]
MEIIKVDHTNIDAEHICCAITEKKGESCISSKKLWLKERFEEGLVFRKLNARGKVFIEYTPAENAWCPIDADNYIFINCFWVSGSFKGKGYGSRLLEVCIEDAKSQRKKGLVVLSSKKKMPYLSEAAYLKKKGFEVCDAANPYFELLYLPFDKNADKPKFKACVRKGQIQEKVMVLYYSNQCPHTEKYAALIEDIAKARDIDFIKMKYQSKEEAQNAPSPFTTYSLFYDGELVTHEVLSEKKFIKILEAKGL